MSVTPTSSSASPTLSYTRSPTPSPSKSNSSKSKTKQNTAAIAGSVIGGVVAITFAGFAIFRLRRSLQTPPTVSAGVSASQPRPSLLDEVSLSPPAKLPVTRFYVCAFVPCVMSVCPHMLHLSQFRTPRTRETQLRFQDTKVVLTCGASFLKHPGHQTSEVETPQPTRGPRCPGRGISRPPHCLISSFGSFTGVWDR